MERLIPWSVTTGYDEEVLIVSDRNIPFVTETFSDLGTVVTLPAAQIDAVAVREADLLLCRTTLKVGPALLDGSKVRFVATATIGTDHLDLPYLAARGISWASAPGSNADSVALWWAAAMAAVCKRRSIDITALRVGVVGVGHVGERIAALSRALGPAPILCDPPRARAEGPGFTDLDALIAAADVISLHVPLSDDGEDRTRGLMTARRIAALRPRAIFVNACRGEVVDGEALTEALASARLRGVLDVFPGEPSPDPALIAASDLATPHIAGHSLDGKVNGTDAIYRAACAFLGREPTYDVNKQLTPLSTEPTVVHTHHRSDADVLDEVLRAHYEVLRDDTALREITRRTSGERGPAFRTYRDEYAARREPKGANILLEPRRAKVAAVLEQLGAVVLSDRR